MCGIVGHYSKASQSGAAQLNLDVLTHRGPNHADWVHLNEVMLGHTRLSIVDVEHGHQPLQSPDGRYWVISNGEIYNHKALRSQFPDYTFQTDSDSEVILALYQRYGQRAVEHLDGMFAFVLYDTVEGHLYMGRDPIGIKPLYYGWQDGVLYFASEIKAIHQYVKTLHEFPPGHYYFDGEVVQYYDLHTRTDKQNSTVPTPADIRHTLEEAVRKRLMSDVPLGVYLSGGLDSTIIAAIVARMRPGVHSFAVGVEGSEDLKNAREAAKVLGTQHHEYIYTEEEMLKALPEIIYYLESFDPLLVRSAIPNYFLARMTRQYVTVVLTGEGADELYAGYHYLKKFDEDAALHRELLKLTETLYNCNLQRCDRMTMAHSIEARVPFLDIDFIELSMQIPRQDKIHPETQTEKWILRRAFEDILPEHVTWRKKEQFSKGAGSSHLLEQLAESQISDASFAKQSGFIRQNTGIHITSKEMLLYYNEFIKFFDDKASLLVSLWQGHDVQ